ncbi:hypothetical protein DR096_02965 [Mycoplasma hyopneumoniae]|uniref:aromatic motif membrane protein n=1 Tax=Mesomycoplasma hyopneumoniae TaxID=2099 RepID=UPI00136E654C|nr:hypothetical protein [Mesomycoplasma hyopneumoniae]
MKKLKKSLFFGFIPFFSSLFLLSCANQVNFSDFLKKKYQKFAIISSTEKNIAQPFFENSSILELLTKIYPSQDSKKQLISRIKKIETEKNILDLAFKLNFYNPINPWPGNSSGTAFGNRQENPLLYEKAKRSFNDLFENNWLWLLANLQSAIFVRGLAEIDQFQQQNEDLNIDLKNQALKNSFYLPKSNKFNDIVIVKLANESKNTEGNGIENYKIFLLNEENYIFTFNMQEEYKNNKLINTRLNLSPWIRIYPKFLNKTVEKFPLDEYARIVSNYRSGISGVNISLVEKSIFEENQGGSPYYYTLVDFQKKE